MAKILIFIYSALASAYIILFFALVPVFAFPFSLIFGLKRSFRFFFKFFIKFGLVVFGCFPSVSGLENMPKGKNVILISNHPSFFDPFLLNAVLPGFYNFIVFASILFNPYSMVTIRFLDLVVRRYGHRLCGSSAIIKSAKAINKGDSFILFPSERAIFDGHIEKIKPGLYKIIEDTDAVILPVFIKEDIRITFIKKPFRAKVVIGKPLDKQHILYGKDNAVREAIASLGISAIGLDRA
jgi:1-acyl-sn-glycerol-3-phosphate acyltransferase